MEEGQDKSRFRRIQFCDAGSKLIFSEKKNRIPKLEEAQKAVLPAKYSIMRVFFSTNLDRLVKDHLNFSRHIQFKTCTPANMTIS